MFQNGSYTMKYDVANKPTRIKDMARDEWLDGEIIGNKGVVFAKREVF